MLELGGGALAVLALGGAAFAVSRRRRRREEEAEWYANEAAADPYSEPVPTEQEPVVDRSVAGQPQIAAPAASSAFAWGNGARRETRGTTSSTDRRAGESWVDRAYRGPTPDNPSLSLRKRLKRAAFFDKREREAAEGGVARVDPGAGLPEGSATEKELVAA